MKTTLFFMSGTGNSLSIAKRLAIELGGEITLTALQSIKEKTVIDAKRVGVIIPVYFSALPELAQKAIRLLSFPNSVYNFGITTCGGADGNTLFHLKTAMNAQGTQLHAGFTIIMPDNSIILPTSKKTKKALYDRCGNEIRIIANDIKASVHNDNKIRLKIRFTIWGYITRIVVLTLFNVTNKWASEACIGCGLCEQICMAHNIVMENRRPQFLDKCAQCFGCAHWCPTRALRYGLCRITDKTHYTHPEVSALEIIRFNF